MTDKQLMEWYQKYWKEQNPTWTRCDLLQNDKGDWILKVKKPEWQHGGTVKYLSDAKYAYGKVSGKATIKKSDNTLNLNVKMPTLNDKPRGTREFKTLSCCIDIDFYNKVKKACDSHNMTTSELIKKLLEQAIGK